MLKRKRKRNSVINLTVTQIVIQTQTAALKKVMKTATQTLTATFQISLMTNNRMTEKIMTSKASPNWKMTSKRKGTMMRKIIMSPLISLLMGPILIQITLALILRHQLMAVPINQFLSRFKNLIPIKQQQILQRLKRLRLINPKLMLCFLRLNRSIGIYYKTLTPQSLRSNLLIQDCILISYLQILKSESCS